jgi:hypothetical protein
MNNTPFNSYIVPFYYCLILSVFSAIQLFGLSNDYYGYLQIFGKLTEKRNSVEPAFIIMRGINDFIFHSSLISIFFISAFGALLLKVYAIKRLVESYDIIILLYYFITFYWLHEYTQIRVAVAIGIYFNAVFALNDNKIFKYCIYACAATLFHYSAATMIFFLFFIKIFNTKQKCLLIVAIGFVFAIIASKVIGSYFRDIIYQLQMITGLNKSGSESDFMSVFNLKYLALLFAFFLLSFFLEPLNRRDLLLFQSFAFGLCFYYYLNPINLPVISVRLAEFYTSVFIIFLPNVMLKTFKEERFSLFLATIFILFYSYATLKTTGIL